MWALRERMEELYSQSLPIDSVHTRPALRPLPKTPPPTLVIMPPQVFSVNCLLVFSNLETEPTTRVSANHWKEWQRASQSFLFDHLKGRDLPDLSKLKAKFDKGHDDLLSCIVRITLVLDITADDHGHSKHHSRIIQAVESAMNSAQYLKHVQQNIQPSSPLCMVKDIDAKMLKVRDITAPVTTDLSIHFYVGLAMPCLDAPVLEAHCNMFHQAIQGFFVGVLTKTNPGFVGLTLPGCQTRFLPSGKPECTEETTTVVVDKRLSEPPEKQRPGLNETDVGTAVAGRASQSNENCQKEGVIAVNTTEVWMEFDVKRGAGTPTQNDFDRLAAATQRYYRKDLRRHYRATFLDLQVACHTVSGGSQNPRLACTYNVQWNIMARFQPPSSGAEVPEDPYWYSVKVVPTEHHLCRVLVDALFRDYLPDYVCKLKRTPFTDTSRVFTQQRMEPDKNKTYRPRERGIGRKV